MEIGHNFFFLGKIRDQTVAALAAALVTKAEVCKSSTGLPA
jgi:hypothetical protein